MSSFTFSSKEQRYLLLLALFSAPVFLLLCSSYLFLRNAGELLPIHEILTRQGNPQAFCLYGTALYGDTYQYKMDALALRKPEIVTLGSSRMLQFRERFFAGSFYNMGNIVSNLDEALDAVKGIIQSPHKPKTILFGVDFWWFNGTLHPPAPYHPRAKTLHQFEGYFLFKPLLWIRDGKMTVGDYVRTIFASHHQDRCRIGIQAIKRQSGFGPDGSQYPFIDPDSNAPNDLQKGGFSELQQIRNGEGWYSPTQSADFHHIETFLGLITTLQEAGIEVNVIFPPFAPSIVDTLNQTKTYTGILRDLHETLRTQKIFFLDATDPRTFGSSDCEFFDGVHPGDVTNARLLLRLDEQRIQSGRAPIGNTDNLRKTIRDNAGLALARDPRVTTVHELDFLHIGCPK